MTKDVLVPMPGVAGGHPSLCSILLARIRKRPKGPDLGLNRWARVLFLPEVMYYNGLWSTFELGLAVVKKSQATHLQKIEKRTKRQADSTGVTATVNVYSSYGGLRSA